MTVAKNKVVTIAYSLADADGEIFDSSTENGNLAYLHGTNFLVPGIERRLEGQTVGFELSTVVSPADGYGEYDESLIFQVTRKDFSAGTDLYEGLEFEAEVRDELRVCTIAGIEGDTITVDANHPLAGETLHVQATIVDIREATKDELKHGHAHGEHGHHH